MENIFGHIYSIIGIIILLAASIGGACYGVSVALEAYARHKTYTDSHSALTALREVSMYCSAARPEIKEILLFCENRAMSVFEFRELLNKKYPL